VISIYIRDVKFSFSQIPTLFEKFKVDKIIKCFM